MDTKRYAAPRRLVTSAVLGLAALAGCGDSDRGASITTYPVKGKVQFVDGKPLTEGTVTFVPKGEAGRQAAGKVQSDGTYELMSSSSQKGAAEGEYLVRVESDASGAAVGKGRRALVNPQFADENVSGLTATVKSGDNDIPPLVLDPAKLPPPLAKGGVRPGGRGED